MKLSISDASALAILAEAPPDADFPEMFREELQEFRQSLSGPAADIAKVLRHEVDVADVAKPIREAAESIEQWVDFNRRESRLSLASCGGNHE
ncbi:MAG TPA: hypothetical protein VN783_03655 [Thermoanaerobaculia bacterium]|nr:hypothetical protein [Thermoanaerobaculia bacterium]